MEGEIVTRSSVFWRDARGIVRVKIHPGTEMTLADAEADLSATAQLGGGRPRPLLVDIRSMKSQTRECRAAFASEESERVTRALALLIGSPVSRVFGNFYFALNSQRFPTRLFTEEQAALEWLAGFAE